MGSVPLAELVNLGFQWVVGREGIPEYADSAREDNGPLHPEVRGRNEERSGTRRQLACGSR